MKAEKRLDERRRKALRIFEQENWGNLEILEEWDGDDLDDLKSILSEEEFQTLLDRMRDQEDDRR